MLPLSADFINVVEQFVYVCVRVYRIEQSTYSRSTRDGWNAARKLTGECSLEWRPGRGCAGHSSYRTTLQPIKRAMQTVLVACNTLAEFHTEFPCFIQFHRTVRLRRY